MVRRSHSSNPRSVVVLTAGPDWRTRAAGQRRGSGAEFPLPRRQGAKLKALQRTIGGIRTAINAKRWHVAHYLFGHARALVRALPVDQTTQEREQLSVLRKKFDARGTTAAAKDAAKAKLKRAAQASGKKAAGPKAKKVAAKAPQKPKPTPAPDLGNRYINRAAFGYAPTDKA